MGLLDSDCWLGEGGGGSRAVILIDCHDHLPFHGVRSDPHALVTLMD